ncbi:hypothetical protein Q8W71_32435 [Methylobacterium sp. NEAU 140]|uniref:hypothetical protein n=1 Tax=Methylobacterium sp. NEAU 140 TaxID=3064945 RepID=UPI002736321E|nr:hypothetical protein [Methylobacterium sp. NEAU 140]MDP4027273.1 hypothetical protein [Methylobacterium sp. NEAU 140]
MLSQIAVAILDSLIDIFHEMHVGNSLGLQVKEITRRLHLLRREVSWTTNHAFIANRLKANAAFYAKHYMPDGGNRELLAQNDQRLNNTRVCFIGLRERLLLEAEFAGKYDPLTSKWIGS